MTKETLDIIQTLSNFSIVLSFGAGAWQLWLSNKQARESVIQKRSEYIIALYNTFVNDKDMMDIYYELEYSVFIFNNNFHESENEKKLDKLLGHFSNIGRLYYANILTREDLKFFEYEFLIIYQNENIQAYFTFLDDWFKKRQIKDRKFDFFRKTAQLLEKDNTKETTSINKNSTT